MAIRQDIERFHLLFCKALLTAQDRPKWSRRW